MNLPQRRGTGKRSRKPEPERAGRWEYLSDTSPRDKPWDQHRSEADGVGEHLTSPGTERWLWKQGKRMEECAPALGFAMSADLDTGEARFKLATAKFCRVRHCPVCQWRRALMWKARFYQALPAIVEQQRAGRWLFLTLTVRNGPVTELREQLAAMNKAFHRLVKRKEFRHIAGWIRSTEITRGKNGTAHPHFHVLLLAKSTYFKGPNYTSTAGWVQAWREALRVDYDPICDIRAVKADKKLAAEVGQSAALAAAVAETLKYSVKPADMLADRDWFLEMVRQTFRTRAIAAGGLLKEAIREQDETQQDLLLGDDEKPPEPEAPVVRFDYAPEAKRYRRKRSG